jgi:hypothetical protein
MLTYTYRTWVHADPGVIWSIILDSVENPQRYVSNVEDCRVLERLDGGVIRELTCGYESAPGVFDFFVVDGGILREIKSTDNAAESVHGVFRFFSFESAIVLEVTVQGVRYREKILISREDREVRRELLDHPASNGKLTIKVVPLSTQNPMAPVDLQFEAALAPSASHTREYVRWREETERGILEEQRHLKEVSEEREMGS